MLVLARRGFTLIELMIALVLLGLVSAGVYKVLVNNQRIYLAQTQTIDLQQNMRAAAAILPAELRELDAPEGDITFMGPDSIRIRAMRQLSFVCQTPLLGGGIGQIQLFVRTAPVYGNRQVFSNGDSLLVYWEGNPQTRSDDQWLNAQVQKVDPGTCSDSGVVIGGAAVNLTLQPQWINNATLNRAGAILNGSPVRGFDKVVYRSYQAADGNWYLGQRNVTAGSAIQPVVGPLIGANGLSFTYYDSVGAVTNVPTQVAQIEIVLRARTAMPIRSSGATGVQDYKVDSVVTRVTLRGNPRCGATALPPRPCN
jgi:prepilin-type N-terminal cleavage/methylation domain-containing protein